MAAAVCVDRSSVGAGLGCCPALPCVGHIYPRRECLPTGPPHIGARFSTLTFVEPWQSFCVCQMKPPAVLRSQSYALLTHASLFCRYNFYTASGCSLVPDRKLLPLHAAHASERCRVEVCTAEASRHSSHGVRAGSGAQGIRAGP